MRRLLGQALWALVAVAVMSGDARAQADREDRVKKEQAKALYDEALRHYNVAEYDAAIEGFKESYVISGDPRLLFNVAQSYRLKGNCEEAVRFYKNFLRTHPDAGARAEAEAAMGKCEAAPDGRSPLSTTAPAVEAMTAPP